MGDKSKLKRVLRELEKLRGRHTELVSYYIPAGSEISKATEFIGQEQALTRNVKNKTVRKNVTSALEKILQELKLYKSIPPAGMAIFSGNVSEEEGKTDFKIWTVIPEDNIRTNLYRCGQRFELDPLRELIKEKNVYGVICLDKGSSDIAIVSGKNIQILKHMTSLVPGKTRAGGQSSVRFYRVRENLLIKFLQDTAAAARDVLSEYELKGLILSGPGPIKEKFEREGYLTPELKKKIIGLVDTSEVEDAGVRETLERGKELIAETEFVKEQNLLHDFFVKLARGKGEVVYGEADTIEAVNNSKADLVLIIEDHQNIDKLEDLCEHTGTKIEVISTGTQEGVEFKNIGGIGAILRYS